MVTYHTLHPNIFQEKGALGYSALMNGTTKDDPKQRRNKKSSTPPKGSDKYFQMRLQNNVSSRIYRAKRKEKERMWVEHVKYLETENSRLKHAAADLDRKIKLCCWIMLNSSRKN